jgi:hypothetical protein
VLVISQSAVHEIQAMIPFLIAAVLFVGGAIVEAIYRQGRQSLLARTVTDDLHHRGRTVRPDVSYPEPRVMSLPFQAFRDVTNVEVIEPDVFLSKFLPTEGSGNRGVRFGTRRVGSNDCGTRDVPQVIDKNLSLPLFLGKR